MEPDIQHTINNIESRYHRDHSVSGVSFVAYREPPGNRLATDDDNALYTGLHLAAMSYRHQVFYIDRFRRPGQNSRDQSIAFVHDALDGIELLTTVTGTPGVLVRQVFPLDGAWARIGYDPVASLMGSGNTFGDRIREGRIYHGEFNGEDHVFLTKTTKDQISGVLFGLTCAWKFVPEVRWRVKEIVSDLWDRMQVTDYSLVDHRGNTHGTSAHKLDAPLRVCLDALYSAAVKPYGDRPDSVFFNPCINWIMTLHYNRTIQNTYTYNLNLMIAHSLMLLNPFHDCGSGVRRWRDKLHSMVEHDNNPHFDLLAGHTQLSPASYNSLKRRINEPYYKGFCWSRDPDEWFGVYSDKIGPGIDAMLPYWMMRYNETMRTAR